MFRKGFNSFLSLNKRHPVAVLLTLFIVGILFWGGFNTAMQATNNMSFCISCHEMRDNVYLEYKQSIHFSNRTGVRATCPDCHVPKEWQHMLIRKIAASNELMHKFLGSIDTAEKFQAKRQQLAATVWQTMTQTDSRECRNCHDFNAMNLGMQKSRSKTVHSLSEERNKTCIDCHKGIAHQLPAGLVVERGGSDDDHAYYEKSSTPCHKCHADMQTPPVEDWGF